MIDQLERLQSTLGQVTTEEAFDVWVRREFRHVLPHAVLLGTMGRMLGFGSVATHRIGVDFPLNLVESLKNATGAMDDPLLARWFKNGRPNYINIVELNDGGDQRFWRRTMLRYGIRGMSVHGFLDRSARRFAAFQLGNPFGGGSTENLRLLGSLAEGMAEAVWRSINTRSGELERSSVFHPVRGLTVTEIHIIELIAQGLSNKEIARRRGVSDSTIKTQVQRTGAKLGATRRAEIVAIAMPMLTGLPAQALIDYDDF